MTAVIPPHPAPFSDVLMPVFARVLDKHLADTRAPRRVLDPFAGTGRVHELEEWCQLLIETTGVELLPKWAASHPRTIVGDACHLPLDWTRRFRAVATSPCYGNRMADHHEARDACSECSDGWTDSYMNNPCPKCKGSGVSPRRSYAHYYGRDDFLRDAPLDQNAGAMAWGDAYRALHEAAWRECHRVLKRGGLLVLDISDHVRKGEVVPVSAWHRDTIKSLGFTRVETIKVPTPRFRYGENSDARAPVEHVYVFRKEN